MTPSPDVRGSGFRIWFVTGELDLVADTQARSLWTLVGTGRTDMPLTRDEARWLLKARRRA